MSHFSSNAFLLNAFLYKSLRLFPKQLQLMGFSILAKKQTLFQLDLVSSWFPGLSPFVSLLLNLVSSWFPGLSPFVSLLLDLVSSWFPGLSPFVSLLLDLVSSWFPGLSPFLSLLLDLVSSWFLGLSPFLVSLLLDLVSSWFPGLFPFVSLLLDLVSSWFLGLSPFVSLCLPNSFSGWVSSFLQRNKNCYNMISRFVSLCRPSTAPSTGSVSSWCPGRSPFVFLVLDPVSSRFPGLSPFVSLLLGPVSSWFPGLSPFVSLLLGPVSSWFPGLSPFVSLLLAWDPYGQDAADASGTDRDHHQCAADPAVQSLEEGWRHTGQLNDLPLAHTGDTSTESILGTLGPAEPEQSVDADQRQTSPTSAQSLASNPNLGAGLTRKVQHPEALDACLKLQLINDHNDCCVNANTVAFLWGFFHCTDAHWPDLGQGMVSMQALLSKHPAGLRVRDLPEWKDFWNSWGRHTSQRDALEFLATFLTWCSPKFCDEVEGIAQTCDRGDKWLPPSLCISHERKEVSLQELLDTCCAYQGMETRFVNPPPLLVLHLDRFFKDEAGALHKLDTKLYIPDELFVPCWADKVLSAVVHIGQDRAGHLRAVLAGPEGWYLTDDAQMPQHSDLPFAGFDADVILLWLVQKDRLLDVTPAPPLWNRDMRVHQVVHALTHRDYNALGTPNDLRSFINSYCAICGKTLFSYDQMILHIKEKHSSYWPRIMQTYATWRATLKGSNTPCCYCGTTCVPSGDRYCIVDHGCPALLMAALAALYHCEELQQISTRYSLRHHEPRVPVPPAADPLQDLLSALMADTMPEWLMIHMLEGTSHFAYEMLLSRCDFVSSFSKQDRARLPVRTAKVCSPVAELRLGNDRKVQKQVPSTGSCFVMISRFVSLCLPSIGSCFVMISRFVSLCLPSIGSCFVMISRFVFLCLPRLGRLFFCLRLAVFYRILFRHDFQVGLPLSSFYWILFRRDFQVGLPLSPFYWIQFHHDVQSWSPFYWILFRHAFQFIDLDACLPWVLF